MALFSPESDSVRSAPPGSDEVSLLEIMDSLLNTGVVIQGSIVISLAGVDLVYVGLNVVLTSVESALRHIKNEQLPAAD